MGRMRAVRSRLSPPVLLALALPLLLAVAVAAIAINGRVRGVEGAGIGGSAASSEAAGSAPAAPETGPLALVPVDAPDAAGPQRSPVGSQWPTHR